jgi:hypothetical protein
VSPIGKSGSILDAPPSGRNSSRSMFSFFGRLAEAAKEHKSMIG